jgi:outer membrane protein insertion porin family
MRSFVCLALVCLCADAALGQRASPNAAQEPNSTQEKPPPPGTLHSVSVKGNRLYSAAAIEKVTGLKIGQAVTAAIFEEARNRVLRTELFTNITYGFSFIGTPPAYDLTIEVVENEQVYPMRFERLNVPNDALRQYLRENVELYADRIPGGDNVLKRYTAAVQEFVAKTSPSLKVKARVISENINDLAVLFAPDEPLPTIAQFLINGNSAVDSGTLLRAINDVAIGSPFTEARIQQILEGTVKRVYASKGYMAVTFPKIESEKSTTSLGYVVKVEIKEGPVFKVGAIRFHGSGMDEEEIRSVIPVKPGQPFNGDQVEEFRRDLTHRMQRRGYLDVTIEDERQIDEDKHLVNLGFTVTPGSAYTFGSLDIKGLDLNTEPVIRKLWGEKPGQPFNPDYPEFFLKRIREQGLFDNLGDTKSDYTADASSHTVVVHLYFKGGKPKQNQDPNRRRDESDKPQGTPPDVPQITELSTSRQTADLREVLLWKPA